MHCKEVQELIYDRTLNRLAQDHLKTCPQCQSLARDVEVLDAGLRRLAKDAVPEPSWGFAGRVLARLDEPAVRFLEPLEVIGRRAVYAAGLLAMTVIMVVALSKSGPVRGSQGTFSLTRQETSDTVEVLLAGGAEEFEEVHVLPVSMNGGDVR